MRSNRFTPPDETCIAQGVKFVSIIERGGLNRTGQIRDESGAIRWRYETRPNPAGRSWRNPLHKPVFVFTNTDRDAEISIRRVSLVPSVFQVLDRAKAVGRIAVPNVLGIKYRIVLDGNPTITFRLPLFNLGFWGDANGDPCVWTRVGPSKMQWNTLFKPGTNTRELAVSLAFIHNQWWNYG